MLAVVATRTDPFTSRPVLVASTYAFVAASCALVGSATPVILALPIAAPLNVGVFPVPSPRDVLAVFPDSYAKAPAPVATINSPSPEAAPNVSKSSNTPSTATVAAEAPV